MLILSFKQSMASWRVVALHFLMLLAYGIIGVFVGSRGLAGGFIRGMLATYVLSVYLTSIKTIIERERVHYQRLFSEGLQIFSPLISVFFSLMLINFLLEAVNSQFILLAFGILFSVLANPLPEIIYIRGGMLSQLLIDSFEFVRDNFFEWFAPTFLVIILFFSSSPRAILTIFQDNPLRVVESVLVFFSIVVLNIRSWMFLILALYAFLFLMLFRGNLYLALEKGRRSRLYLSKQ